MKPIQKRVDPATFPMLAALNQKPIAYLPLYRDIMGSTAGGLILSQLMYWLARKPKHYKTDEDLIAETHVTPDELRGAKKRLKDLPFLVITREGVPAKTFYEIDWQAFTRYCVSLSRLGIIPKLDWGSSPNYKKPKTTTNYPEADPTASGKQVGGPSKHPRWRRMAEQLHSAIRSVRQIDYTRYLGAWANSFYLLHRINKVPTARIRAVLNWYCHELPNQDPYLPVAFSGKAFRDKFPRIEQAMARKGGMKTTPPDKASLKMARQILTEVDQRTQQTVDANELAHILANTVQLGKKAGSQMDEATVKGFLHPEGHALATSYGRWLVGQIERWPSGWTGGLKSFAVGGTQWRTFIRNRQRAFEWDLTKAERKLLNA